LISANIVIKTRKLWKEQRRKEIYFISSSAPTPVGSISPSFAEDAARFERDADAIEPQKIVIIIIALMDGRIVE
jgi:hypothetical protein